MDSAQKHSSKFEQDQKPGTQVPMWDSNQFPAPYQIPGPEYMSQIWPGHEAQNRVLHDNELSRDPKGLANKLPFSDIPHCKGM